MKLSELFSAERILPDLESDRKDDAIREIVQLLCKTGAVAKKDAQDVERAILRREELGSTGIGKGVGVPHAKHPAAAGVTGAFARSKNGVAFQALDGQPVHLVFLILSSPEAVEPHLEALRRVTALIKDDDLCVFMRRAEDGAELAALLKESDERLPG